MKKQYKYHGILQNDTAYQDSLSVFYRLCKQHHSSCLTFGIRGKNKHISIDEDVLIEALENPPAKEHISLRGWIGLPIWALASLSFFITALLLKNLLDLRFFPIYKPNQVFEAWCSHCASRPWRINLLNIPFLSLRAKSAVLTNDPKEEYSKRNEACNATNKEQAPEAHQRKLVWINLVNLHWALSTCQPFIMDLLKITILWELKNGSW